MVEILVRIEDHTDRLEINVWDKKIGRATRNEKMMREEIIQALGVASEIPMHKTETIIRRVFK